MPTESVAAHALYGVTIRRKMTATERLRRDGVDVLPFGEFAREVGERRV
jgi:hypothetical protein